MPPFAGTEAEKKSLAAFIAGELHDKDISDTVQTADSSLARGQLLFEDNCSACHATEDLAPVFEEEDIKSLASLLLTLDEISDEMEPFGGTEKERSELAEYLDSLQGGQ